MIFEVLIDDLFINVNTDQNLSPIENKRLLSLINDFENGEWRHSKFQNFIWDNIAETSLSHRERNSLINHSLLTAAAKSLRLTDKKDDISEGSELAEIVLYGIMKHHFNAISAVPKIFYKQNSQDNAKGADSVHITITDDDFLIWFGEAKFYNNIEDARLGSIVKSVQASLKPDKLKRENSIIINVSDIDYAITSETLRDKIKKSLSPQESIDNILPKINIPILILHECAITKTQKTLSEEYKQEIIYHHKQRAQAYFKKQIRAIGSTFQYSEIKFHIILFPVPSKEQIVKKFISNVTHYKEQ